MPIPIHVRPLPVGSRRSIEFMRVCRETRVLTIFTDLRHGIFHLLRTGLYNRIGTSVGQLDVGFLWKRLRKSENFKVQQGHATGSEANRIENDGRKSMDGYRIYISTIAGTSSGLMLSISRVKHVTSSGCSRNPCKSGTTIKWICGPGTLCQLP